MKEMRLSQEEIKKRLIRLRNLEYLHESQRLKIWNLQSENRKLKKEIKDLKLVISEQQKTIKDLKLQIEELRTMVFGRKKKKEDKDENDLLPPKEKIERDDAAYQRPIPKEEEITKVISRSLNCCNKCSGKIIKKKTIVFYEEDIPIPARKVVLKHVVEKGYCSKCKKWVNEPLPNAKVILGQNVQKYVCYLSVICRLSFTQIQNVLKDTYQIHISQGEIAKILDREAIKLRPFFEQLKLKIRGEPGVHLYETSWKQLCDGSKTFSWVMSGVESKDNVFLIGESRGKGNMEKLLEDFDGFTITDDYVAYQKLKKNQLCFAHLIRKWRDLTRSEELNEEQRNYYKEEYVKLCLFFEELKQNRKPEKYKEYFQKLKDLSEICSYDSLKAKRIKLTLRKNIPRYLTCLSDPRIPLTNNQAERSLRHLVLKRKISFGSLTKRTAKNLSVLLSSLMSLKKRYQDNFFAEYLKV